MIGDLGTAREVRSPSRPLPPSGPGLVLASRGDALTPSLFGEVERRYPVLRRLDTELAPWQRAAVAASTFRPSRARWAELFYKSPLGYRLRTANATAGVRGLPEAPVLQVHTLFEVPGNRSLLYVDCTHAQSAQQWPAWNPLRGEALHRWYARERRAYRAAGHVFSFSRQTRRSLLDDYGVDPAKVTVVGAGINAGLDPRPHRPRDTGPGPRLLFIGNDFARKGGPQLLAAFAGLRAEFPTARLDLVGTRPDVPAQPGVAVHGRVADRGRISDLYAAADLFVLPSLFDPLPLVLLEAMDMGVPVVTTSSCGIPDVIRDGREGTLVPAGDAGALLGAVTGLLRDPDRAGTMAAAATERVRSEFTWARVVDRMAPVLDGWLTR